MRPFLSILVLFVAVAIASAQKVVCIDPGHPSEVGRGTQGKKVTEIQIAWKIALLLKQKLEAKGYKVVLTKNSQEQFVKNRKRSEIANAAKADYFVRLHCDAAAGSGLASYYPAKAGRTQGHSGPSQKVIRQSTAMAKTFHAALIKGLEGSLRDNGLKTDTQTANGAKHGALVGSIFSEVPVILVEMVVLTNRKDEAFISTKAGMDKMATALAAATDAALKTPKSPGTISRYLSRGLDQRR